MKLNDTPQRTLVDIAAKLPPEKRRAFFERCEALLAQRPGRKLADYEVTEAAELVADGATGECSLPERSRQRFPCIRGAPKRPLTKN